MLLFIGALAQGYQWASRYDGPGHGTDQAAGLALYHGVPYVAGSRSEPNGQKSLVALRHDPATGMLLSSSSYRLDTTGTTYGTALAVSSAGSVYIVGSALRGDDETR